MNLVAVRRLGAIAGAATITTAITMTGTAATTSAGQESDTGQDRPCFMIRPNWNSVEGPQPTCPDGRWRTIGTDRRSASSSPPPARVTDFMP